MHDRLRKYFLFMPLMVLMAVLPLRVWAAGGDFSVGDDFLKAELNAIPNQLSYRVDDLRHFPALTLEQLLIKVRGQLHKVDPDQKNLKAPINSVVGLLKEPLVFVSGPKTKGQLTPVLLLNEADSKAREAEDILREAEAARNTPIPDTKGPAVGKVQEVRNFDEPLLRKAETQGMTAVVPRLQLRDDGNQLIISPRALKLFIDGPGVDVMDKALPNSAQIFLRNSKIVAWDAQIHRLKAQKGGHTELYISYRDQLYIVPVEVHTGTQRDPLMAEATASFQKLTSIMPLLEQPYASFDQRTHASESEVFQDKSAASHPPLTLASSAAEVDATQIHQEKQLARYFYPDLIPENKTIAIQVIDERSAPEQQLIYPVAGVTVRLLGTRLAAKTDAKGHALFGELPEGSRFFVQIEDEKGVIVPGVTELSLPLNATTQVLRVRTIHYRNFLAYLNIIDRAQDTSRASLCARAMSEDGRQPLEGVRVSLNVEADGAYYLGSFGPQKDLQATDASGRFCFFNIVPGLVELSFFQGDQFKTSVTMPVFPGAHSEEDLILQGDHGGRVFVAAMPSAVDQIYEEKQIIDEPFQAVDYVDMLAVGENTKLSKVGNSILGYESGNSPFKGRLYMLSQAPEFETALYTVDRDQDMARSLRVLPLLQRGFIEDVFHELAEQGGNTSIAFDPALGSAVVLHRLADGQDQVQVSLIDSAGQIFDQGWSFGSMNQGLVHTVFFNLQPGVYQVKVETKAGTLIAINTFAVDYWTSALIQTGSTLHYNLQQLRRRED